MRSFLIAAIATAAVVLADPVPAKAQIIIGGPQPYTPRYYGPFVAYPRAVAPVSSEVLPVQGGPVNLAVNTWLRSLAPMGYGPYASNYGFVNSAASNPWSAIRSVSAPPTNWKWAEPWSGNPGLHQGWFKGGGKRR
jgi:hypothetical protein